MGDIVIILILIVIVGVAVMGTVKRIRHGSSCCGEHDAAPKKIRVSDHNKNNYPYAYEARFYACGPYCDCGYKKRSSNSSSGTGLL